MSVFEINKIMQSISRMGGGMRYATLESVYNSTYFSEQASTFDDVLHSVMFFGLLKRNGDRIMPTNIGNTFIELASRNDNGTVLLDGNKKQDEFLLNCLDGVAMHEIAGPMLEKFSMNYSMDPAVWNARLGNFDEFELAILSIFEEIGITTKKMGIVEMENMQLFSALKNGVHISNDDLLGRMKEIGDAGEGITIEYERMKLVENGLDDLAEMVKQVSLDDPYAGYDVASFDRQNAGQMYCRFIEVKSTTGVTPRFYWSRGEVDKAKKLREKYWVYLWTDVEGQPVLHMIQDPYSELFEGRTPKPEPYTYIVSHDVLKYVRTVSE